MNCFTKQFLLALWIAITKVNSWWKKYASHTMPHFMSVWRIMFSKWNQSYKQLHSTPHTSYPCGNGLRYLQLIRIVDRVSIRPTNNHASLKCVTRFCPSKRLCHIGSKNQGISMVMHQDHLYLKHFLSRNNTFVKNKPW